MTDDLISRIALLEFGNVIPITAAVCDWNKLDEKAKSAVLRYAQYVKRMILGAPAVDAVEVVRCKDCIHYEKYPDYANECWNNAGMLNVYDDGFCSFGERRADGT